MSQKTWNIALVGCGGMAANYRHRYTQIPAARLALLIDVIPETAREAAAQLDVAHWSTDFAEALAPGIDIVDISTPNHLHAEQAVAALKAGKHVLLQKPIAPTVAEAEAIVETAKETGLQAGMYMSFFDHPLFYELKKLIEGGFLGRISAVHCRAAHRGGLTMKEGNWRQSAQKTGGGSFIQLAVHPLDMAQWLLDERIVRVAAFSKNMFCPNVGGDDLTAVSCEFAGGILATLTSAYCADQFVLAVYGTKGYFNVLSDTSLIIMMDEPYTGELIRYERPGEAVTLETGLTGRDLFHRDNPYDQHIAFVKAIQAGKPAPIPAEVGLYDLKVVAAVYESARERRFVEII
ncbi:MAG: Gfo/Idh/MocA family protein [Bacteroidota bacterium]